MLKARSDGAPVEQTTVTVGADGVFQREFPLRENDVFLVAPATPVIRRQNRGHLAFGRVRCRMKWETKKRRIMPKSIPPKVLSELKRQLNQELNAAHGYLAMSIWCLCRT